MLKYYINTLDPILKREDGSFPISYVSLVDVTNMKTNTISKYISDLNPNEISVTHINGGYIELKIIKPTVVPSFILNQNLSTNEKKFLIKVYEHPSFNKELFDSLDYKSVSKHGLGASTNFYKVRDRLIELNLNFEDLFLPTSERQIYHIGDNINLNTISNMFVYGAKKANGVGEQNPVLKYFKSRISDLNSSGKKREIDVNITADDLVDLYVAQDKKCYYSGLPLSLTRGTVSGFNDSLSFDRADSSKGYTKDNLRICYNIYNKMKANLTDEQFKYYVTKLVDNKFGNLTN